MAVLLLQWILLLLSTTELIAAAGLTYTLPSGATITTGNDYYVTSWVVITPSDTQVGLLNATVKDQIVNPYTVDASKLTGTGVNPSDELAGSIS